MRVFASTSAVGVLFWVCLVLTNSFQLNKLAFRDRRLTIRLSDDEASAATTATSPELVASKAYSKPVVPTPALKDRDPNSIAFITCSSCKTAYSITNEMISKRGMRVKCSVCEKEWFQSADKILYTDESMELIDMSPEKSAEIKQTMSNPNGYKYIRFDKVGLFVGNLPYSYNEQDVMDIFAEYGVLNVALIRDPEGQSKGFAFVDVPTLETAEKIVTDMNQFFTEENRRLTVRLQQNKR